MRERPAPALLIVAIWLICMFAAGMAVAQHQESPAVVDEALGIAFRPIGAVQKTDSITYSMSELSSALPPGGSATAEVSVSNRPFVDLPGSYGGRLFLDMPPASRILRSRVFVDTVLTAGYAFRREYWTVYAGMGMWEGVINCYAYTGGRYCIVSLIQEIPMGKPGEHVEGSPLTGEGLNARLLSFLRDSTGDLVSRFDGLLSSVQITSQ
jgi:hypothetical protein